MCPLGVVNRLPYNFKFLYNTQSLQTIVVTRLHLRGANHIGTVHALDNQLRPVVQFSTGGLFLGTHDKKVCTVLLL